MQEIREAMQFAGIAPEQQKIVEEKLNADILRLQNAQKAVCPECKTGKHGNCDGHAGITDNDEWIFCGCIDPLHN